METKTLAKTEKNITDSVLLKITQFQKNGALELPDNYSPANALKSAYLILTETKTGKATGFKPVLEYCTKESIANSLLNMVVQGLNPMKKQCYFIPYGDKLQLSRSYQGTIAMAKRTGLKTIVANAIYKKDKFGYEIDPITGLKRILNHAQEIGNIILEDIAGAYAIVTMENDVQNVEIMTILQIKKSWLQGAAKGNSGAHLNFTDEMAKKTIISRACKGIINSSDDTYLVKEESEMEGLEPKEAENAIEIGFEEEDEPRETPVKELSQDPLPEVDKSLLKDKKVIKDEGMKKDPVKKDPIKQSVNQPNF